MKLLTYLFVIICWFNIHAQNFDLIDETVNSAISDSIFPGAVILVGTSNEILYHNAYGHFTYDESSDPVTTETMFDLASVTKAFGTNFCVMKLVDEGKLDIEEKVSTYLPEFAVNGKENVRVIDLLIHESGLPAYYSPKPEESREEIIDTIMALKLSYDTGTKMIYSCLNFVTTMLVVEAITGDKMYKYYAANFTEPLGMTRTMWIPGEDLRSECAPTQDVQGIVHDPLARGLGGLSGNAGLFSTTGDLAKLCQLLLNKGTYDGKRYLQDSTIEYFSKRYSDISTRAIGFDTRSDDGKASSGQYFKPGTYGHLGYTGTSIWIDPAQDLFVIFLTNRVYPDDTKSIRKTRPKVYDAVMMALGRDEE
jgi:CubicO group peptidase (beta-lactamase class C family)